eukprot:jgi/Mesvir1/24868/Mv22101-RA.1
MASHRRGLSPEARLSVTKTLAAIEDDEDEDLELDFNELFDGANHKHRDDEGDKADQNGTEERNISELSASERSGSEVSASVARFLGAASLKERGHSFVGPTPSFEKPGMLAELRGLRFAEETMGNAQVLDALQELQEAGAEAVEEEDGDEGSESGDQANGGKGPNGASGGNAGNRGSDASKKGAYASAVRGALSATLPSARNTTAFLPVADGQSQQDGSASCNADVTNGIMGGRELGDHSTAHSSDPASGTHHVAAADREPSHEGVRSRGPSEGSKDAHAATKEDPQAVAWAVAGPCDGTSSSNNNDGAATPLPQGEDAAAAGLTAAGPAPPSAAVAAAPAHPPRRKLTTDDFELLRVVGQGAFGKVFAVVDRTNQQVYAMKVMRKDRILERRQTSYMRAERDILKAVRHPYIVTLRYSFQSPSKLYLVLDFINGGHLFFQLYQQGTFSEELARFYMSEIVLAVQHLHSLDIIHRDLKPENILLDHEGHVKITDFGLAKPQMAEGRATNSMAGTVEYMAPEIVLGKGHSKPADWWSVGILLFEMLTGSTPFATKDRSKLQTRIVKDKVKLPPFLSPRVASLLKGLLNKDPAKRLAGDEILRHPFFQGIKWAQVESRQMSPPFLPAVESERCFRNFDEAYTRQLARDSPCDAAVLANPLHHDDFMGFSYEYGPVGRPGASLAAMEHVLHVGRAQPQPAADQEAVAVLVQPAEATGTDASMVSAEDAALNLLDAAEPVSSGKSSPSEPALAESVSGSNPVVSESTQAASEPTAAVSGAVTMAAAEPVALRPVLATEPVAV